MRSSQAIDNELEKVPHLLSGPAWQDRWRWLLLVVFALGALIAGILLGPVSVSARDVMRYVTGGFTGNPLVEIRFSRTILAFFAGAALAASGAALQPVFRNPMADPYLLGSSAGASLSVSLAWFVFGASLPGWAIPAFGFVGALATSLLVLALARLVSGSRTAAILLIGIAVSFFCSALVPVFMVLSGKDLYAILFFLMGSVQGRPLTFVPVLAVSATVAVVALALNGRTIDFLQLGEERALTLGIEAPSRVLSILALAAFATGASVAVGGIIGFVGLVCPHLARGIVGERGTRSIVASALVGAGLLCVSDVVARLVIAPKELPLGVVTALIGSPFLVWTIFRAQGRE